MINRKMESSLEKSQSICNDELQVLRKELEPKNKIISKLLKTIENISNKAVQPNPLPVPHLHLQDDSNDTNKSDRKEIIGKKQYENKKGKNIIGLKQLSK